MADLSNSKGSNKHKGPYFDGKPDGYPAWREEITDWAEDNIGTLSGIPDAELGHYTWHNLVDREALAALKFPCYCFQGNTNYKRDPEAFGELIEELDHFFDKDKGDLVLRKKSLDLIAKYHEADRDWFLQSTKALAPSRGSFGDGPSPNIRKTEEPRDSSNGGSHVTSKWLWTKYDKPVDVETAVGLYIGAGVDIGPLFLTPVKNWIFIDCCSKFNAIHLGDRCFSQNAQMMDVEMITKRLRENFDYLQKNLGPETCMCSLLTMEENPNLENVIDIATNEKHTVRYFHSRKWEDSAADVLSKSVSGWTWEDITDLYLQEMPYPKPETFKSLFDREKTPSLARLYLEKNNFEEKCGGERAIDGGLMEKPIVITYPEHVEKIAPAHPDFRKVGCPKGIMSFE